MRPPQHVTEEQACEIGMHPLVSRNELVAERQARHQATLLQPEDGREGSAEENALDCGERDEALSESRACIRDPTKGPVGLPLDARDCFYSVEKMLALSWVLDVGVDKQRVSF